MVSSLEWCYECGALREHVQTGPTSCKPSSAWCKPTGPGADNPFDAWTQWRDRLLDLAAIYGHTACREGMALASEGDDFRAAGKVREEAWAKLLEVAFNPPASVDPHVRAAVERRALEARNDRASSRLLPALSWLNVRR